VDKSKLNKLDKNPESPMNRLLKSKSKQFTGLSKKGTQSHSELPTFQNSPAPIKSELDT
jgi:hypothetical protein